MRFIDNLTENYWHLFLGVLVLLLAWHIGKRLGGERRLAEQLPRTTAALDLFFLPLAVVVAGSLLIALNRGIGVPGIESNLRSLTLLATYLAAGWALGRLIEVWLLLRSSEELGERMPRLIIGLIYFALLLLGLALFLWQEGYSFTGLWVSTGVAAAVLGLALQKTLGDLFSGIALTLEGPFRLGDWVELDDGTLGEVLELNWRATHLRGWDNATHVIPNSRMAGHAIKNLHGDDHLYAPWYFVKLPAEVDPRFATALLLDAAMRCETVLKFPNPVVRLADAEGVPYSYMVWVHLRRYPDMFRGREELYREIHRSLRDAGIETAAEVREMRTRRATVTSGEPPTVALALKALDFADELTDGEMEQIAARSEYRNFDVGQVLLAEGAGSDAFYVIAGGLVDTAVRLPDGSRKTVETLVPGKHFGLESMLTPDPGFLEYVAKTDVTLIRVDLDCVRGIVGARPELAQGLATVIKDRLDAAEAARIQSRRRARRMTLREIRREIEQRMRTPPRLRR
jgi:small-conductance mechanosensitive channel/CRP-like cAMP-binding protein